MGGGSPPGAARSPMWFIGQEPQHRGCPPHGQPFGPGRTAPLLRQTAWP